MRRFALTLAASLLSSSLAFAADGAEVLGKVEKALSNFSDQVITFEVLNLKPGKSNPDTMRFVAKVKGPKSYTEFLSPGDIKGTRVLSLSPTEMWVYLPEYGRVRRVASHALEQGFMGTVLTQQDMAVPQYGATYTPELTSETEDLYTLTLKAKEGMEVSYKTMRMTVRKDLMVPTKIEYLADGGEVARTETRGDYDCNDKGYCMFGFMKMVDHTRSDAWTELKPVDKSVDNGLDDSLFTQRTLQIGG